MNSDLKNRILFFVKNAGYCDPPGRLTCAKQLAEAEILAEKLDLKVQWEIDSDADASWMSEIEFERYRKGSINAYYASIQDDSGNVLASLGGIFLSEKMETIDKRVFEAELYLEALSVLKKGEIELLT